MNVVKSFASSANGICKYLCLRSSFENTLDSLNSAANSSTVGNGYLSGITAWFTRLKSIHISPDFLRTTTILDTHGDDSTDSIIPSFSKRYNSLETSSRRLNGRRRQDWLTGCTSKFTKGAWAKPLFLPRPVNRCGQCQHTSRTVVKGYHSRACQRKIPRSKRSIPNRYCLIYQNNTPALFN